MNILVAKSSIDIEVIFEIIYGVYYIASYITREIVEQTSILVTSNFFYIPFWTIVGMAILIILVAVLQQNKPKNPTLSLGLVSNILFSPLTFKTAKFVWKRRKKIPVEKQQQILNVAKKLSEPETRQLINQTATNLAQQYLQKNKDANNTDSKDKQPELQTESNKQIDELVIETEATDNKNLEIANEAKEKGKTRKIIERAANELAKNYLEQETKNTQDSVKISDSKTRKVIAQTAKAVAKAYLEETSETKESASETEEKPVKKSRLLGRTVRSLAKNYLQQQ